MNCLLDLMCVNGCLLDLLVNTAWTLESVKEALADPDWRALGEAVYARLSQVLEAPALPSCMETVTAESSNA